MDSGVREGAGKAPGARWTSGAGASRHAIGLAIPRSVARLQSRTPLHQAIVILNSEMGLDNRRFIGGDIHEHSLLFCHGGECGLVVRSFFLGRFDRLAGWQSSSHSRLFNVKHRLSLFDFNVRDRLDVCSGKHSDCKGKPLVWWPKLPYCLCEPHLHCFPDVSSA